MLLPSIHSFDVLRILVGQVMNTAQLSVENMEAIDRKVHAFERRFTVWNHQHANPEAREIFLEPRRPDLLLTGGGDRLSTLPTELHLTIINHLLGHRADRTIITNMTRTSQCFAFFQTRRMFREIFRSQVVRNITWRFDDSFKLLSERAQFQGAKQEECERLGRAWAMANERDPALRSVLETRFIDVARRHLAALRHIYKFTPGNLPAPVGTSRQRVVIKVESKTAKYRDFEKASSRGLQSFDEFCPCAAIISRDQLPKGVSRMALMGCKWNDLGRRIIEPRRFREDIVVLPFMDLPKILRGESEAEKLKTGSLGAIEEFYVETHGVAWLLWCFHAESSRMGEVYLAILRPFFEILQQIPQHSNPAVKRSVILQHSDEGFLVSGEPFMRETLCEVVQFIWFFCSSRTTYTPRWFWPLIERIEMDEEAVELMQALSYRSNLHWNLSVEMS